MKHAALSLLEYGWAVDLGDVAPHIIVERIVKPKTIQIECSFSVKILSNFLYQLFFPSKHNFNMVYYLVNTAGTKVASKIG